MKRAAQILAWAMVSMALPAYYSMCVILVLEIIGAVRVSWLVILGLALYVPLAIAVDVAVKVLTTPQPPTEPGGRPGTEG